MLLQLSVVSIKFLRLDQWSFLMTSLFSGHLFCHKCIVDTLRFSEIQRADETLGKPKGTCPVCRKAMVRNDKPDKGRTLIPLGLKLSFSTRNKGKGKEVERDPVREFTTISVDA